MDNNFNATAPEEAPKEETQKTQTVADFLNQDIEMPANEKVTFDRFKGLYFEIKPLTNKEMEDLRKQSTTITVNRAGQKIKSVDQDKLVAQMMAKAVVNPDLTNNELQTKLGTIADPAGTLSTLLLSGEYAELSDRVQKLSGFESASDAVDDAKN
jgi:hypothetical protein